MFNQTPTLASIAIPDELNLRINNPYSIGNVFLFPEFDYLLERKPITVDKSPKDRYYQVVQGDTLSSIAFLAWGNSKWWWILDDVNELNMDGIDGMLNLTEGTVLYIPDLERLKVTTL